MSLFARFHIFNTEDVTTSCFFQINKEHIWKISKRVITPSIFHTLCLVFIILPKMKEIRTKFLELSHKQTDRHTHTQTRIKYTTAQYNCAWNNTEVRGWPKLTLQVFRDYRPTWKLWQKNLWSWESNLESLHDRQMWY